MNVRFPVVKNGSEYSYPDDKSLFSGAHPMPDGYMYAEYRGSLPLEESDGYVEKRKVLSNQEFSAQFLPTEYRAIASMTATDDQLFQFWDMATRSPKIDLEYPATIQGMAHLVSLALITQDRHDEIMEGV